MFVYRNVHIPVSSCCECNRSISLEWAECLGKSLCLRTLSYFRSTKEKSFHLVNRPLGEGVDLIFRPTFTIPFTG